MDQERNEKYLNRELSWLKFNERVLNEANDLRNDVLDRIKFLTISASNLDEFDMVRLAGVETMYRKGNVDIDISGRTFKEQYEEISAETAAFTRKQYDVLEAILDDLKSNGFTFITDFSYLNAEQLSFVTDYYQKKILPFIEVINVPEQDAQAKVFYNSIENKSLNVCMVDKKDNGSFDTYNIAISKNLDRFVEIPTGNTEEHLYTFCENIIEYNLSKERPYAYTAPYRVTRNASFVAESRDISRLMDELEEKLNERRHGNVVKLEIANNAYPFIKEKLKNGFDVDDDLKVYNPSRPIDLTVWKDVTKIPELKKEYGNNYEYVPRVPKKFRKLGGSDIFKTIRKKDAILFHPYDSFKPVLDFIDAAANDKKVTSIKQTLYRVSKDSPIVKSLRKAAKNGKDVTVLVELKARFNEEDNIAWAKKLEEAGCKVLYGVPGLKVHSKITTVEREENGETKYYTHLSTGNYNEVTANIYTDMGLLTADEEIGLDAKAFFEHLETPTVFPQYRKLIVAPEGIKPRLLAMIQNEIKNVNEGRTGSIKMKMNSLCDEEIIDALYEAGEAGVKVELLVRGICCIKPTKNIVVESIVGEYLEHSRIYEFHNDGDPKVFLSSADCMPRNLNRRVEILFPIEDEKIKQKVSKVFELGMLDDRAYILEPDGEYSRLNDNSAISFSSQSYFKHHTLNNIIKKDDYKYVKYASDMYANLEEDDELTSNALDDEEDYEDDYEDEYEDLEDLETSEI